MGHVVALGEGEPCPDASIEVLFSAQRDGVLQNRGRILVDSRAVGGFSTVHNRRLREIRQVPAFELNLLLRKRTSD